MAETHEKEEEWLKDVSTETLLWRGKAQEECIVGKIGSLDTINLLSAFLLAFSLNEVLNNEKVEFFDEKTNYRIYLVVMTLANSFGFATVLICTFVSAQFQRRHGQTIARFGDMGATIEQLESWYGKEEIRKKLVECSKKSARSGYISVQLPGRWWYYEYGKVLFQYGLYTFHAFVCFFFAALTTIIFDQSESAGVATSIICILILWVSYFTTIAILYRKKTFYDLK